MSSLLAAVELLGFLSEAVMSQCCCARAYRSAVIVIFLDIVTTGKIEGKYRNQYYNYSNPDAFSNSSA